MSKFKSTTSSSFSITNDKLQWTAGKGKKKPSQELDDGNSSEEFDNELSGKPYRPPPIPGRKDALAPREDNTVVYLEISAMGGVPQRDGSISPQRVIGKLFFELRSDLVPVACENFLSLVTGMRGHSTHDGVLYHYKGTRIHRIIKGQMLQGGDLLDQKGNCSRSIFNEGGLFMDENFILRHTGPGCISYCNRGPDTNGSLFQVVLRQNVDLDGHFVVFGCLASDESYEVLGVINSFGTESGEPTEGIRITDCGIAYQKFMDSKNSEIID